MKLRRREFLGRTALGLAGSALAPALLAQPASPPGLFAPYEPVPIGKTKLRFSRVVLGTGMRGGNRESNQTRMGKEKFEALIREANDRGVDTYDLADLTAPILM